MEETASTLQIAGAIGFGTLVGWYVYYVNRHRTDQVRLADVGTLVATIGGGAVLALFPAKSDLFGAYGIGLFAGFFGYLLVMAVLVKKAGFGAGWFLDGRRPMPGADETTEPIGPATAMGRLRE